MTLSELVQGAFFVPPEWDREFLDIVTDSRDVSPGDLFVARAGSQTHGEQFIAGAIERGAAVVLAEGELAFRCEFGAVAVPVFSVPGLQASLPQWLHRRYPSAAELPLLGVTGTNGKSSCVSYVAQLSTALGQPCGVLGTLGNGLWPALEATRNTTPDLSVVLKQLTSFQQSGAVRAAMEVSSHGLDQGRVDGLTFDAVMLTNLSQDHLDYHGTMDAYFAAKVRLFEEYQARVGVVNADDAWGQGLLKRQYLPCELISYGAGSGSKHHVQYRVESRSASGVRARIASPWGDASLQLPLLGDFNLANAVGAITLLAATGMPIERLIEAAANLRPVAGRMNVFQPIDGHGPLVVVDYAHTPDAVATVLASLTPWQRPLSIVFGCGGDRDRSKRPAMLQAALTHADRVWLTDDNPRAEAPEQIFADVTSELQALPAQLQCVHDRRSAITSALAGTASDGILVIAGKGHEDYQEVGTERIPFSDIEVLQSLGFEPLTTGMSATGGQTHDV